VVDPLHFRLELGLPRLFVGLLREGVLNDVHHVVVEFLPRWVVAEQWFELPGRS